MPQSTILLILLAAIVAIVLAGFQYLYRNPSSPRYYWWLVFLRAAAIFCVLLLLINPKFESNEYYVEKPELIIAVDNSASIKNFKKGSAVKDFVASLTGDKRIKERFNISTYAFGNSLNQTDSFSFDEPQTNIHSALQNLDAVHKDKKGATLLITDGNQTFGREYQFQTKPSERVLIPVLVGDTAAHRDLSITEINVNKFAFLNNDFPVEIFINYAGQEAVQSELRIHRGSSTIFSEKISFNASNTSAVVKTTLPASEIGPMAYQVEVRPLEKEKNLTNNQRNFSIEVIDERSKVLLVSDLTHPDLGALKNSIESNQQREVVLVKSSEVAANLEEYSLVILYQPTTFFRGILEQLEVANSNYWIITGPNTDWRFLNNQQHIFQKEAQAQTEEYLPVINEEFTSFQFEDIGFSGFPPLVDSFGELTVAEGANILLFQEVNGFSTEEPLLSIVEEDSSRKAFLFGANLWRWRSEVFAKEGSFEQFDQFLGALVQFLSSQKRKDRLSISYENFYLENDDIILSAQYFDKNYNFDQRGKLILHLTNTKTKEKRELPLRLAGTIYQADLSGIPSSEYQFTISAENENISRSGAFTVADYEVEDQFTNANLLGLQHLADQTGGKLRYLDQVEEVKEALLKDNNFVAVQKSHQNSVSLVEWYYLLGLLVLFLGAEWFLRKYHGLI